MAPSVWSADWDQPTLFPGPSLEIELGLNNTMALATNAPQLS